MRLKKATAIAILILLLVAVVARAVAVTFNPYPETAVYLSGYGTYVMWSQTLTCDSQTVNATHMNCTNMVLGSGNLVSTFTISQQNANVTLNQVMQSSYTILNVSTSAAGNSTTVMFSASQPVTVLLDGIPQTYGVSWAYSNTTHLLTLWVSLSASSSLWSLSYITESYTSSLWIIGAEWTIGPYWIIANITTTTTYPITFYLNSGGTFYVNGSSIGNGTVQNCESGDVLTLSATPNLYYSFANFTYDSAYTISNPYSYTVSTADVVTCNFQVNTASITFDKTPVGIFYVNGTNKANESTASYNAGTVLQLSAVALTNYTFGSFTWTLGSTTSNPYYYTVSGTDTIWANFLSLSYSIIFYKTTADYFYVNGTLRGNGTSTTYTYGDTVNLTAVTLGSTTFSMFSWTGGNTTSNPYNYTVTGANSVWAIFVPTLVTVTVYYNLDAGNTVYMNSTIFANGSSTTYNPGATLILLAVPAPVFAFQYFSYGLGTSAANPTTYVVPAANDTIWTIFSTVITPPTNIVFYFRSDTHTVNNVTGYNMQTSAGTSTTLASQNLGSSGIIVEYGFTVDLVDSHNQTTSLTGLTPTAIILRNGEGEGFQSALVSIGDYPMSLGLESLKVVMYVRLSGGAWLPSAVFTTDRLMYKGLNGATWNFTMYTKVAYAALDTVASAYWGSTAYASGIAGPTFIQPLPQEVDVFRLQSGDWIGAVLAPYMIFAGDLVYGFGLLFIAGALYLRHKKFEVILVALLLFAGSAGVGFLIPNVAYRLLYIVVAFVIAYVLYRVFR